MAAEYKFEPADRAKGYIYPLLSKKDEFVPDTHIGMYSILRNPKNKNVYLNEQHCQKIRQDTFDNIMKLYHQYGSPDIATLFNTNIDLFTEAGLNEFAHIRNLIPLRNVIELCVKKTGKSEYGFTKREIISFGIRKDILEYYFNTRKVPILQRDRSGSRRDFILFGADEIDVGLGQPAKVNRTAQYRKFEHWCDIQGVDKQDGFIMALESLFEKYPLSNLLPTSEYDIITEFDKPILAKRIPQIDTENNRIDKQVRFSKFLYQWAEDILARYNRDPENALRQMDINAYINNALNLLNNNMDLKYRNPELQQDIEETKKFVEQNTPRE